MCTEVASYFSDTNGRKEWRDTVSDTWLRHRSDTWHLDGSGVVNAPREENVARLRRHDDIGAQSEVYVLLFANELLARAKKMRTVAVCWM